MFDLTSNLLSKTGFSAGQLQAAAEAIHPGNGFTDFQAFVDAENQYDLNALFILAHAAVESAWGTSAYAVNRNNLFGFNAVDSDPDLASSYSSQAVSIHDYADFLSKNYLSAGEQYFNGATPHGIFVKYSSSHDAEAETVVGIMNDLNNRITNSPAPRPVPAPIAAPANANTYKAVPGDNMSKIASKAGESLAILEQNNPTAGHPTGNFGTIWPGDVFNLSGGGPAAVIAPVYVHPQPGQGLFAIAVANGLTIAAIQALNPNAGHPAGNIGNIWPADNIRVK